MFKSLWGYLRQGRGVCYPLALAVLIVFLSACSTTTQAGIEATAQTALTAANVYRQAPICTSDADRPICAKRDIVLTIHAAEVSMYAALQTYRAAVTANTNVDAARAALIQAIGGLNTILDLPEVQRVINDQ